MVDPMEVARRSLVTALNNEVAVRAGERPAAGGAQIGGEPERQREGAQQGAANGPGLFGRLRQMMMEGLGGGGGAVNEEMVRESNNLRTKDNINPSSARYSRYCPVCCHPNPRQRAVFSACGHIICYPCAVDNLKHGKAGRKCVYCRQTSGFVKLFETKEQEMDMTDDRSGVDPLVQQVKNYVPQPISAPVSEPSSLTFKNLMLFLFGLFILFLNIF